MVKVQTTHTQLSCIDTLLYRYFSETLGRFSSMLALYVSTVECDIIIYLKQSAVHFLRVNICLIQVQLHIQEVMAEGRQLSRESQASRFQFLQSSSARLLWGSAGIYIAFFIASLLDQKIFRTPYRSFKNPEVSLTFSYPVFLVTVQTLMGWLICKLINMANKDKIKIPLKYSLKTAILNVVSGILFNTAIMYLAFPLCLLLKSCNLLSAILVGVCCSRVKGDQQGDEKLGREKLIVGVIVSIGVIMFFCGNNANSIQVDNSSFIGIGLILLCLVSDGFEIDFKAEMKQKFKPRPLQMLQTISFLSFLLSMAFLAISRQYVLVWQFIQECPSAALDIFSQAVMTSTGMMFLFYIVTNFQQHIAPLVVTTRKVASAVISIMVFNHSVGILQWAGLSLVFLGTIAEYFSPILIDKLRKIKRYKQYTMI